MPMKRNRASSLSDLDILQKRHTSSLPLPWLDGRRGIAHDPSLPATRHRQFNERFLARVYSEGKKLIERDSTADLGCLLERYCSTYSRMKKNRENQQSQRVQGLQQYTLEPIKFSDNAIEHSTSYSAVVVTLPLDPQVKAVIENESIKEPRLERKSEDKNIIYKINALVKRGKTLSTAGGCTVTQIHPNIIVKTGKALDLNEMTIMEHIHRVSKSFPSPRPLGSVTYSGMTYHFMTFIEGTSLQDLWPSLSADLKTAVRDQLNIILEDLRKLPLSGTQFGGGIPPRCKDVRRSVRSSSGPIYNENDFNDFLLSTWKPRIAQSYKEFLRTKCLRSHHRIVMTHGDLHPRNILAELQNGHIKVKGIVDWEAGGSYPEYWEYVKSLNTMSSVDEDDWCHYLPVIGMGEYCNEWTANLVLERAIT
ncbi:kinase-like domain-containing protein [Lophiotrema nucula]|uniref:Kinase-like domain-containing protein n=1 Tax=Lophiotrema nucula TaxID=690887 RepID=A0A6A5YWJ6_9PLEO|nr:kinase-like domain-containing protein [Lophiotrema nucula]